MHSVSSGSGILTVHEHTAHSQLCLSAHVPLSPHLALPSVLPPPSAWQSPAPCLPVFSSDSSWIPIYSVYNFITTRLFALETVIFHTRHLTWMWCLRSNSRIQLTFASPVPLQSLIHAGPQALFHIESWINGFLPLNPPPSSVERIVLVLCYLPIFFPSGQSISNKREKSKEWLADKSYANHNAQHLINKYWNVTKLMTGGSHW